MQQTARLPNETDEQYDIRVHKDIAAFGYVWIMSVVVYAMRKDSKFVRWHSAQGMVLFFVSVLAWLIPFFGNYLIFVPVAGMLLGFINAAQGRFADVPLAGPLSRGEMTIKDLWTMSKPYAKRATDAVNHAFTQSGTVAPGAAKKPDTPPADAKPLASTAPSEAPPVAFPPPPPADTPGAQSSQPPPSSSSA